MSDNLTISVFELSKLIERQGYPITVSYQTDPEKRMLSTHVKITNSLSVTVHWTFTLDDFLQYEMDDMANEYVATARKTYRLFVPARDDKANNIPHLEANKLIREVEAYVNGKFGEVGIALFHDAFDRVYSHFWKLLEKAELGQDGKHEQP